MADTAAIVAEGGVCILDYLAFGAGVLDETATLLQSNQYMREVLEGADGLCLTGGRLCASTPHQTQEILDRAAHVATTGGNGTAPAAMAVTRPSGLSPLLLVFAPVREKGLETLGALVFVSDPERSVAIDPLHIRRLFGLTRTESKITAGLAQGIRLDSIADSLGMATSTARSHLKHIFDKTRTERQADLTTLVRGLLGNLRV